MAERRNSGTLGREITAADLPIRPQPILVRQYIPQDLQSPIPSVASDEKESYRKISTTHYHRSVLSSATRSSRTDESFDMEKQAYGEPSYEHYERKSSSPHSPPFSQRTSYAGHRPSYVMTGTLTPTNHTIITRTYDEADLEAANEQPAIDPAIAAKAVRILLFLIFLLPPVAFVLSIWTCVITLLLVLLHPVRLIFTRKRSFSEIVLSLLVSTINFHLRCVSAPPLAAENLVLGRTILSLVAGAFLSMGIAGWSAVLGVYWVFALIIGNPDGLDGRSEGREMALATRAKWIKWLHLSLRK